MVNKDVYIIILLTCHKQLEYRYRNRKPCGRGVANCQQIHDSILPADAEVWSNSVARRGRKISGSALPEIREHSHVPSPPTGVGGRTDVLTHSESQCFQIARESPRQTHTC